MKKFVIVSDSSCELTAEERKKYDIEYLPMYVTYNNESVYADLDWSELPAKEFYDIMRGGTRIFTSQVTAIDYQERFESYVKAGYDVLSISCSSGLSASIKASHVAREEVLKQYPDAKIFCVDSLICSGGLAMLCIHASKLRAEGKTIEETAAAIEELKWNINQAGTVDDLKFLKAAGRISASKALFGTLLNVKPIIVSNQQGENVSVEKAKGRMNSFRRLAELIAEWYTGTTVTDVYLAHADCLADAEKVKAHLAEKLPNVNVHVSILNPVVGASCGPNTLIAYCEGPRKPDTTDA